jgi:hypothetical protein
MLYAVGFCLTMSEYAKVMVRSYWPWIKKSFPKEMTLTMVHGSIDDWLGTGAALGALLAMSLWSGVVASARLLGLKLLAKQMLIMTNLVSIIVGVGVTIASVGYSANGYSMGPTIMIGVLGVLCTMVGCWGFVGAYTERMGLLRLQMFVTVPLSCLIFGLGLEALLYDRLDLRGKVQDLGKHLSKHLGRVSDEQAALMIQSHVVLMGLMALMMGVLVICNLCCTCLLIQRLQLDGRGYAQVSTTDDLDTDYYGGDTEHGATRRKGHKPAGQMSEGVSVEGGPEGGVEMEVFEIGDEEEP